MINRFYNLNWIVIFVTKNFRSVNIDWILIVLNLVMIWKNSKLKFNFWSYVIPRNDQTNYSITCIKSLTIYLRGLSFYLSLNRKICQKKFPIKYKNHLVLIQTMFYIFDKFELRMIWIVFNILIFFIFLSSRMKIILW